MAVEPQRDQEHHGMHIHTINYQLSVNVSNITHYHHP
jgi:hypothetical protein